MSGRRFPNKSAVRFDLVPRPQTDPLIADNDAPPIVLIPKRKTDEKKLKSEKIVDESLLPSKEQAKKGILQKAFEKDGITLDGDILKAMSKEFDYEDPNNIIDDDFFQQAGGLIKDDSEDDDEEIEEYIDFNDSYQQNFTAADCMSLDMDFEDNNAEVVFRKPAPPRSFKSKTGSNFSLTSSIMRRNQGLQQIDEHFERLYQREYENNDDDDGVDNDDNLDGEDDDMKSTTTDAGNSGIDKQKIKLLQQEVKSMRKKTHGEEYVPEIVSDHHKTAIAGSDSEEEGLEEEGFREEEEEEKKIDCESVLSTYSNLYNHPKVLDCEGKMSKKRKRGEREMDVDNDDDEGMSVASSRVSVLTKISCRRSDETSLDRKSRKQAVKQYRRIRREEKKANQKIFKEEQQKLARQQRTHTQIPLN